MKNILAKLTSIVKQFQYELFLGSCIILISIISYNLGQINSLKKEPISIRENRTRNVESSSQKAQIFNATNSKSETLDSKQTPALEGRGSLNKVERQKLDTRVVVSKNSNKYHYTWCAGAKKIKAENQIWFNSTQEAEKAGYVLAGNCN